MQPHDNSQAAPAGQPGALDLAPCSASDDAAFLERYKNDLQQLHGMDEVKFARKPPRSAFCRRACHIKVSLTAAVMTKHEAIEQFAAELRRIADVVEEGVTSMESGNMGCADMGSWEMDDPWESDEPNVKDQP